MNATNQDELPASVVLPSEALIDPAAAVARHLMLNKEDISVVSTETLSRDEIKIRFYLNIV